MDGYKKIIRSRKLRFKILSLLRFIPDKQMLQLQYYIKTKRKLDLKNPKRYTEKLQWYKLYYRDPVMAQCADKYLVRDYIKSKGFESILTELYAVYDSVEEIDWEKLPDKFAMKTSNGSGTNFFCTDKSTINYNAIKQNFNDYFNRNRHCVTGEWVYHVNKPKIIIEQLLEDKEQKDNSICDYKFMCFGGKPEYVVYDVDRFTNHKRNIYDLNWENLNVASDCPCCEEVITPPENLVEMTKIATKLSEDFPAVRVDLYSINGKIYFGELTFFPWSGYVQYTPDQFDFDVGNKFVLPKKNYNGKRTK
ncbi:MAG: carbonic anhydrase [Clostridia bacterium]|nr:carbonic anhydrase [Clostridia bacterium]